MSHSRYCGLYSGSPSKYNKCTCLENQKKEKVPCVACDKEFGSHHALKIHFTIMHKDEIV